MEEPKKIIVKHVQQIDDVTCGHACLIRCPVMPDCSASQNFIWKAVDDLH